MVTSFIQYLLMAPSYIAALNVYAICHLSLVPFPFSLCRISVAGGTKISFPTCMMYCGEEKATTRSSLISVLSARARGAYG
jgi:hypothetical protein